MPDNEVDWKAFQENLNQGITEVEAALSMSLQEFSRTCRQVIDAIQTALKPIANEVGPVLDTLKDVPPEDDTPDPHSPIQIKYYQLKREAQKKHHPRPL